jgi:adenylate kinase family enzyme
VSNHVSTITGAQKIHYSERTEIGRAAEEVVANGDLLPDELMLRVVSSKLDALRNKVCCVIL